MWQTDRVCDVSDSRIVLLGNGSNSAGGWTPWTRPKNARYISIYLIGSGSGGGGGFTAASGSAKGGGGGGAAASMMSAMFPARMLPETLYFYLPGGGAGGGAGGAGTAGGIALCTTYPDTSSIYVRLMASGTAAPTGGAAGTAAGGVAGGTGGTAPTSSQCVLLGLANIYNFYGAGMGGSAGGAITPAAGGTVTFEGFIPFTCGGSGGGSCSAANANSAGGPIAFGNAVNTGWVNSTTFVAGGAAATAGNTGWDNLQGSAFFGGNTFPIIGVGGTGAGGNATGVGLAGGNGGVGSGGGGGGAGTTGGSGGTGGPAAAIIDWW
jgi:hypothetical protein